MIKVVHLNATSAGGAFVAAQRLNLALNELGEIKSEHYVYTGKPGNYKLWAKGFIKSKYAFFIHALEKLDFLRSEKSKNERFAFSHGLTGLNVSNWKMVKEADVIHLHWINKGFISLNGMEKLASLNKPVVWTCHDQWPFTGGCYYSYECNNYQTGCGDCMYLKNPGPEDLSRIVFLKKQSVWGKFNRLKFITPSRWLAEIGLKSSLTKGCEVDSIPNGIDTQLFSPRQNVHPDSGSLSKSSFKIMYAAANLADKRKGFDQFRQVLAVLKNKGIENIEVILVGENKYPENLDLAYPFHFTGYISNPEIISQWYNLADLYITTSVMDNLPTTVMESLACGTPVAAFSSGGVPEMVINNTTGILVAVNEILELANGISDYISLGKEEKIKMSENCRSKALAEYDQKVVAGKYLEVYKKITAL